jgi:hypothetical protein
MLSCSGFWENLFVTFFVTFLSEKQGPSKEEDFSETKKAEMNPPSIELLSK